MSRSDSGTAPDAVPDPSHATHATPDRAVSPMHGRRRPDNFDWRESEPGDYGWQTWHLREGERELFIHDPFGGVGRIAIGTHTVTEHEDGTVTVSPSIAPRDGAEPGAFHGWLQQGVWTW